MSADGDCGSDAGSNPPSCGNDSFLAAQIFSHGQNRTGAASRQSSWLGVLREEPAPLRPSERDGDAVRWNVIRTPLTAPCLDSQLFPARSNRSTPACSPLKSKDSVLPDRRSGASVTSSNHLSSLISCSQGSAQGGNSETPKEELCSPRLEWKGLAPALNRAMVRRLRHSDPCASPAALTSPLESPRADAAGWRRTGSLDNIAAMIEEAGVALLSDVGPELTVDGTQGTYFVSNLQGDRIGVFKPSDEEVCSAGNPRGLQSTSAALKSGIPPGEAWKREIAAYRLDHGHFAGVPETLRLEIPSRYFSHQGSGVKIGSFQRFMRSHGEVWDVAPGRLPAEALHRVAILDIRLCNSDRHGGNILFVRGPDGDIQQLVPIDHGACAPTNLADTELDWLSFPQSKLPFSDVCLEYIARLDPEADAAVLRDEVGLCAKAVDNVRAATLLLKAGAAAGLTPRAIGEMLRRPVLDGVGALESIVEESQANGELDVSVLMPKIAEIVAAAVEEAQS